MKDVRGGSRLRRALRRVAWTALALLGVLAALRGLVWMGEKVPMIEAVGPEHVEGPLRHSPIRFAQTDFWFYPRRVDAEVGYLRVPAQRAHADGETIELRFVRFPSLSDTLGTAPIVYLAGGPGGSGTDSASGDRFPFFMKLREAGDVIAFDQRGTYRSNPFPVCPEPWGYPLDRANNAADLAIVHEQALADCWTHWAETLHPNAFNSVESAADLESLRVALGVEQLSLVGISYGTHLALAYLRHYPDRVARLVLAGVEGPDHTYKRPATVDRMVRAIDRELEAKAGWVGFVADIEKAIDRLAREQPRVMVEHPSSGEQIEIVLGPLELKLAVLFGLNEREDFLKAAKRVRRIAEGDDALLARFAIRRRASGRRAVMPLSMDCASGVSEQRRAQIAGEMAGALIGDVANLSLNTRCPFWPVEDLGQAYRSPLRSDVQVLAVSGTLDVRTPPSNADEVLAGFSRGAQLLIVGGGHGDDLLIGTSEIAAAMARFLRTGGAEREEILLTAL